MPNRKKDEPDIFDIAIVGAGPAGCHLAAKLASHNYKVALFDHKVPWEKPCGGGITHKAWSQFPILADPALPKIEHDCSLQISASGRFFVIDQGHPLFVADRKDLGEHLLNYAKQAGALHLPLKVTSIEFSDNSVQLQTREDRVFTARTVVGADGTRSIVRKKVLGPLPSDRTLTAISRFYEGDANDPMMIRVTPFPGYIWAFGRADKLAVGVGALEPGHDLKNHLEDFMAKFFPERKPISKIQGALLPYMNGPAGYFEKRQGSRWALVGDAAGFCDTLTGEGILYAVWSADLLAKAILKGKPKSYETSWRWAFGSHLLFGSVLMKWLYSRKNVDRFFVALSVCPSLRKVFMNFVWNQPSYIKLFGQMMIAMPFTLAQWRNFIRKGAVVGRKVLTPFEKFSEQLEFRWTKSN